MGVVFYVSYRFCFICSKLLKYQYSDLPCAPHIVNYTIQHMGTSQLASEATVPISISIMKGAKITCMRYICISPVLPSIIKKDRVLIALLRCDNEHPR